MEYLRWRLGPRENGEVGGKVGLLLSTPDWRQVAEGVTIMSARIRRGGNGIILG